MKNSLGYNSILTDELLDYFGEEYLKKSEEFRKQIKFSLFVSVQLYIPKYNC